MNMESNESQNKEKKPSSNKIKNYLHSVLDFSKFDKKTIVYITLFIALIIFSLFLLYYNFFVDRIFLYRLVVDWFVNPIYLLGIVGILLFILIMAIQGLIVPIPSEIVLLATGMIWGLIGGGIMGIIGSMAAALLCFYISKKGGRPLVKKIVGEKAINVADNFIHKYGIWAIIIARFLPFIAFDPISYVSGLVDIDVKKYSLGSFIGSIPRAFFYSWLGASLGISNLPIKFEELPIGMINAQANLFNNVLLIVLAVLVVIFIAYYFFAKYYAKKNS